MTTTRPEVIEVSEDGTERSVSWEYSPVVRQHIRDANRADDCPADLTFQVKKEAVIASGSLETIRWLYDYLHHLKRAWRHEGEQWDADAAEEMAVSLYEQVDGELPDRQRTKELMTDGGTNTADTDQNEYTIEIEAKVRYTEKADSEEIARHNAEQEFIFDIDASLEDIDIVRVEPVNEDSVESGSKQEGER